MKNQLLKFQRFFLIQGGVATALVAVCLGFGGMKVGLSAFLGCLTSALPNLMFAKVFFKHQGAQAAKAIVRGFYLGEVLKITLSIVLFTVVFIMCDISPLAYFLAYISVQLTFWFAPWVLINK